MRRNDRGKHAPQRATQRRPQIKLGQACGCRTAAIEFAMTEHRQQNEGHEIDQDEHQPKGALSAEQPDRQRHDGKWHQARDLRMRYPRPVAKRADECEQIGRERQHPEERDRSKVSRDIGGYGDDQASRNGGQRQPAQSVA
jgi:hypothetical protein